MNACNEISEKHDSEIGGRLKRKTHTEVLDDEIVRDESDYSPHEIGLYWVHLGLAWVHEAQGPNDL